MSLWRVPPPPPSGGEEGKEEGKEAGKEEEEGEGRGGRGYIASWRISTRKASIRFDEYQGDRVDGKKEGKGIYKFSNGDVYYGDWRDDQMDGEGVYEFVNGGEVCVSL